MPLSVSIIIPTWQEALAIAPCLEHLARQAGPFDVWVVDGQSPDDTAALARRTAAGLPFPCQVVTAPQQGRAAQMNFGAGLAAGDVLLFLHADTRLPDDGLADLRGALDDPAVIGGHFAVRLDDPGLLYVALGAMINWRSRLSGLFTGDMGMFVRRSAFAELNGFPPLALMEDLAMAKRLRRLGPLTTLATPVTTAARRWQQRGLGRTILLMQVLRAGYAVGVSPDRLAGWYRAIR